MQRSVFRPAPVLVASLLAGVFVAVLAGAPSASAQSGRKPPPRRPDPVPEAPAMPPPTVSHEPDPAAISVSAAKFNYSFNLPDSICDYVFRACMGRFKDARNFKVLAGDDMNRKKATELAKSGKETYVLLLEFSLQNDMATSQSTYYRNVICTYTVFAPETGKTRTSGRVYFDADAYRSNTPLGSVVRRSGGYTPDEAGKKVAEDVMGSLATVSPGSLPMPR